MANEAVVPYRTKLPRQKSGNSVRQQLQRRVTNSKDSSDGNAWLPARQQTDSGPSIPFAARLVQEEQLAALCQCESRPPLVLWRVIVVEGVEPVSSSFQCSAGVTKSHRHQNSIPRPRSGKKLEQVV